MVSVFYRNRESAPEKKVPFNRKKTGSGPGSYWGTLLLMVGRGKKEEEGGR